MDLVLACRWNPPAVAVSSKIFLSERPKITPALLPARYSVRTYRTPTKIIFTSGEAENETATPGRFGA